MSTKVDLYNNSYNARGFNAQQAVRTETYGEDLGQSSWMTADELRRFIELLELNQDSNLLEVGSGSGGPAIFVAEQVGCNITGLDINEHGVDNANRIAKEKGLDARASFKAVDVSFGLPFDDQSFDAIYSNDAMCHIASRPAVLREWYRVLKPGGRMLFTDAMIVTGLISNEELATRSSIGTYFYLPPGVNERLIAEAGFELLAAEDLTEGAAEMSLRWHDAREKYREDMIELEGSENFTGLQKFLLCVHTVSRDRRLSRFMYLARKSGQ
jgi:cyclopropane fatty-acyl-phospholipid synthase-like methyltransferase